MFHKTTLDNGLRIITAPMTGTNTVTILVLCETGSDNEPKNQGGISHFLEHLFFKGTLNRPTPQVVAQELDSMGGFSNAFTSHEVTGYYIKAGKIYYERALNILADIYTSSLLKAEEIDRERQVIIEERKMRYEDPSIYIGFLWDELLYGGQVAGLSVIGEEETIRSLTPEQFREYFQTQYTARNTIVVVAGNFSEDQALDDITNLFRNVRSGEPRPRAEFQEVQEAPALRIHYKETDQTHLALGFRGFDIHNSDRYAGDILSIILGASFSSRMFDTLREKLGLVYSVYSDHTNYTNRGYLLTYAGVSHENIFKTIEAMLAEYRKISEVSVTQEELQRAKDLVKGRMLIRLESSDSVAHFIGDEEALTKQPLTVDEVFAKIDGVAPSDVERVAKGLIRSDRLNLAVIGPHKDEDKLRSLLTL